MRTLEVLQHCESEFLGLIEDHFEGRGIGFRYVRPFAAQGRVPATAFQADGLVLMGGGAWGAVGGPDGARLLPSLAAEVRLTKDFLARKKPVIAWGVGSQILALAGGGAIEAGGLIFAVETARRTVPGALGGYLPETFPLVSFMRDRPQPPPGAEILALDSAGRPACFKVADTAIGFTGHPGIKPGILEDLLMEFDDPIQDSAGQPVDAGALLETVRGLQTQIADALVAIMTGVVQVTGLMRPYSEAELKRRRVIPIQR